MIRSDFYVYAYFRPDGTPCYVGKGRGDRWKHRGKYGRNSHFLNLLAKARKDGIELPHVKLADGLTDADAIQLERDLILLVGRETNGGPLVNLTDGGEGTSGYRYTVEQLKAHGAIRQGRKLTPEWRENIAVGLRGKPKTAEHNAKVSAAHKGRKILFGWWSTEEGRAKQRANNRGHTGHRHSEETKRAIRNARMQQNARSSVLRSPVWASRNSARYIQAA